MKKLQLVVEMDFDEEELKKMLSSRNNYKPLSKQEYIDGIRYKWDQGRLMISNWIEEYYNANEADSECMKNARLIGVKTVE